MSLCVLLARVLLRVRLVRPSFFVSVDGDEGLAALLGAALGARLLWRRVRAARGRARRHGARDGRDA
eukprot:4321072-Pleurochrysis_carterae.AAC.1